MVAYVVFLIVQSRREQQAGPLAAAGGSPDSVAAGRGNLPMQLLLIAGGLGLLVLGSNWLVDASIVLAKAMGVSDLVIGSPSSRRARPCRRWPPR
jgi:cation:H+ antiporter